MTSRSTTSKRGASKSSGSRNKISTGLPGWVWLLAGLAIGFFGAFLAGLTPSAVDIRAVADKASEASPDKSEKSSQPVFDFYTLLPESELTLPMAEPSSRPAPKKQAGNSGAKDKGGDAKGSDSRSGSPRKYLLQAGSFRNSQDADRLRAQLLLQGLNPKVEKVNVGSGETWHRVQLGPFMDRSSLHNAQQVLASQNIDSLLLQLK